MTREATVMNTADMLHLIGEAKRHGFNRQMNEVEPDTLDPEGVHVSYFDMPHNEDFAAVPHMRTLWYVKVRDTDEPVHGSLDIRNEEWRALHRVSLPAGRK